MDVIKWATDVNRSVYKIWEKRYPEWKPGIKVFYSKVLLKVS